MILVTGASGFVGRHIVETAVQRGMPVRASVRGREGRRISGAEYVYDADLSPKGNWWTALDGARVVVHAAARVHIMKDTAADPAAEFRRVNVDGTASLARQAALAGVRRFVFISSVKVLGEQGAFTEWSRPAPCDPYGISKHEAEIELRRIGTETGIEVVVVRPPLVYGPGVRANFHALAQAVARGIPLPLGSIDNRRSFVALGNLVDFLLVCTTHHAAAHETFLVSDGEDLSTPDLVRRLASAMGCRARLWRVPTWVLLLAGGALRKRAVVDRLVGNLQVDSTKARRLLNWKPPLTVDQALSTMMRAL